MAVGAECGNHLFSFIIGGAAVIGCSKCARVVVLHVSGGL